MLVLTRKLNESIVINGSITVKVVGIQGNKVRLGITAPLDVTVDREEVARQRAEFDTIIEVPANEVENAFVKG